MAPDDDADQRHQHRAAPDIDGLEARFQPVDTASVVALGLAQAAAQVENVFAQAGQFTALDFAQV